jgi:quercetin dioxygenase-like cupin family protein
MNYTVGPVSRHEGLQGLTWHVLGQTYVPLHVTALSASLHATMPPGTFVPMHKHEGQDETLYMLEGELEFHMNGSVFKAGPGTQVTLPRDVPHAFYNKSDKNALVLVSVAPANHFFELMQKISGLPDPVEVARIGGEHGVPFV